MPVRIVWALGMIVGLMGPYCGSAPVAVPVALAEFPLLSASIRVGESASLPGRGAAREKWRLPLAFEPVDAGVPVNSQFAARGDGYTVIVGSGGALLVLPVAGEGEAPGLAERNFEGRRDRMSSGRRDVRLVRVRFEGANPGVSGQAQGTLPGRVHRLRGSDPGAWQTGLETHARVRYSEVYPGIDVAFHGHGRELEYDFIIAPGADPTLARLRFDGVRGVEWAEDGSLGLETGVGIVRQRAPFAYQEGPGGREVVRVGYRRNQDGSVGFALGTYDRERPLVIDPVLSYATFLGGTGVDQCWDIAVDSEGTVWVTGETESPSFAHLNLLSTNGWSQTYGGGEANVAGDAFVARLNADGTAFDWFTYLGGSDLDGAFTVRVASNGEPVVGGFTTSTNFPITPNAFQSSVPGLTNRFTGRLPYSAFVTRLTADGSGLVFSTLLGGDGEDQVIDLELLADGQVVAVGSTSSTNLPLPASSLQGGFGGGLAPIAPVLTPSAPALAGGSFLGGSDRDTAEGVAVVGGMAHVVGITLSTNFPVASAWQPAHGGLGDAFVAGFRLGEGENTWSYSTYLGGADNDYAYRAGVGPAGKVWLVGETGSTNFPVVGAWQGTNAGVRDGFIARFSADGGTLEFSSYLGGAGIDALWDVQVDSRGYTHFVGESYSLTLPGITPDALQSTNRGASDLVLARLAPDGTLSSTFYGSVTDEVAYGVAVDAAGNTYAAGRAFSALFPVSSTNVAQAVYGGGRTDGFVLKLVHDPQVTATLAGDSVEVSWPAPNPGFVLETTPALAGEEGWSVAEAPVAVVADRHVARLPRTGTNLLFRLRWDR